MNKNQNTLLALDWNLIASQEATTLVREEAWKHAGNPIIHEGRKDFFLGETGYRCWIDAVIADGGTYRMWYSFQPWAGSFAASHKLPVKIGYAESNDGIDFRPVKVGPTPSKGSRRTNIVDHCNPDQPMRLASIIHDPADRSAPYKALAMMQGSTKDLNPAVRAKFPGRFTTEQKWWFVKGLARSQDGLTWDWPTHDGFLVDEVIEGPRLSRCPDGGYLIANQMHTPTSELDGRRIKGFVTYDGLRSYRLPSYVFSMPDHVTRVQSCYLGPLWGHGQWVQSHVGLVPCQKGPTMIALHGFLYGAPMAETYAQVADIGLAISSTGYTYQQVWPFVPFLRRGNKGEWDSGLVWQCALSETREQSLFYYGASSTGNADACHYRAGVGLIPRDRYAFRAISVFRDYKEAKPRRGEFVLKAQTLPAKPKLALNVTQVTRTRTVRAELRDPQNKVIPGFSFKDCVPVTTEGLQQPVRWRKGAIQALAGQSVKIAIELVSPDCQYGEFDSPRVYAIYSGA